MKKSLLLLLAGLGVMSAGAQVMNPGTVRIRTEANADITTKKPMAKMLSQAGASKTTAFGGNDWFFYDIAVDAGTASTTAALINAYPDSNIYFPSGTPSPFYIWSHGIGTSFDPTSPYFSSAWQPTTSSAPGILVTSGSTYTIDSIDIAGLYQRVNTIYPADTLFIDVTYTSDTGAWNVTYSSSQLVTFGIIPTPVNPWDTTWTIADAYYNWSTNSIEPTNTTPVFRFTKVLDGAAAADTLSNGLNEWKLPMTGTPAVSLTAGRSWPMVVPAGKKVVAYAHFASGHAYPLGTANTAANLWRHYCEDFGLAPLETFLHDENCGLSSSTDDRYHLTGYSYLNLSGGGTAPILTSTYFYTAPVQVHNPWYGFHVVCAGCFLTEVANTNLVSGVTAQPNPAGNMITITYTTAHNASGTATLSNMLGQVVATKKAVGDRVDFNVASLPNGIYIYNLEINGQRTSGRVVVAH